MRMDFIVARKILKIGNMIVNDRTESLKAHGLTAEQSETLLFYGQNEGNLLNDLKDHLHISHQAARNLVERLKAKEILYTTAAEQDGRAKAVYLTEKGKACYASLTKDGSRAGHVILKDMTETEREQLIHLLDKISMNLEGGVSND